ncbi:MAG: hypothetical protein KDJ77_04440 [Rhodobiaceae bacterium]|nr:hypothetical protein [Rhodobiaceae bacterium]
MLKRAIVGIVGVVLIAAAGFGFLLSGSQEQVKAERPDIPFAPLTDDTLHDPDNPVKTFRVDFARVEHDFPLSRDDLMALTPANLLTLNQEEIDQIYGRLTAGPIPDGPYLGDLFFPRGDEGGLKPRLEEILGGLKGRIAGAKVELAEKLGRALWKGKLFYRDDRVLRNFIEDFKPLEDLIDDPDALMKAEVPREGWLKYIKPTTNVWLMFPAKLYCGQSLVDGRREAVIIDYAYTDEIEGYQKSPDSLAGRGGLMIRDEIRMVRPGFYLGRAYANKVFLLNFTLYNAEVAEAESSAFKAGDPVAEDCWTGEQVRSASVLSD